MNTLVEKKKSFIFEHIKKHIYQYIIIGLIMLIIVEFYMIKQRALFIFNEVDNFKQNIESIRNQVNGITSPLEDFIKNTTLTINGLNKALGIH